MAGLELPDIQTVREAKDRISGLAIQSPLVKLDHTGSAEIYLKLESEQPSGSFKIRCAANALLSLDSEQLSQGIFTASAGNFALGLAYAGRELGLGIVVYACLGGDMVAGVLLHPGRLQDGGCRNVGEC